MVILKSSVSDRLGAPRAGALAGWSDRRVHGCLNSWVSEFHYDPPLTIPGRTKYSDDWPESALGCFSHWNILRTTSSRVFRADTRGRGPDEAVVGPVR